MSKFSPLPPSIFLRDTPEHKNLARILTSKDQFGKSTGLSANPYLNDIQPPPTDKKRREPHPLASHSILLEQNQTLLQENRQMAVLIHEKNMELEGLERSMKEQVRKEAETLRLIEREKEEFILEVKRRQAESEGERKELLTCMQAGREEQQQAEMRLVTEFKEKEARIVGQYRSQIEELSHKHGQSVAVMQQEHQLAKDALEKRCSQLGIQNLEMRQNVDSLGHKVAKLKEEVAHTQHLKKIEMAELKQFYLNKMEATSIEASNAREKAVLECEGQLRIKNEQIRSQEQKVEKMQAEVQQKETEKVLAEKRAESEKARIVQEVSEQVEVLSQQLKQEKEKNYGLLNSQSEASETAGRVVEQHLAEENSKLMEIVSVKNQQVARLMEELDGARRMHAKEVEDYDRLVEGLRGKVDETVALTKDENESLKVHLGVLRQNDLASLKDYYENSLQVMSDHIHEKQGCLASNRERLQGELQQKAEMRQSFEAQLMGYKLRVKELETELAGLKATSQVQRKDHSQSSSHQASAHQKELRSQSKAEGIREADVKHLQEMIGSKDGEIEELQRRIQMMKENHLNELGIKDKLIEEEREKLESSQLENNDKLNKLNSQIAKIKQLLKSEKDIYDQEIDSLNALRQREVEHCQTTHKEEVEKLNEALRVSKKEAKDLSLEVVRLETGLEAKDQLLSEARDSHENKFVAEAERERRMLEAFYEDKLRQKEEEIVDLKERVAELSSDLRDGRENYAVMERKLEQLIQGQSELREVERRVMELGRGRQLSRTSLDLPRSATSSSGVGA